MKIKHDQSHISINNRKLVERGYGRISASTICFEFLYSPDVPQKNEVEIHPSPKQRNQIMKSIMDAIDSHFVCYQYSTRKGIYYESQGWELFFWCRLLPEIADADGEERDFSYFTLTFNSRHSLEHRQDICDRLLLFLEKQFGSLANLFVLVRYNAVLNEQKIADDAKKIAPFLDGTKCVYCHCDGRLVYSQNTLFFMKKYAKHRGYALRAADILQIKWQLETVA